MRTISRSGALALLGVLSATPAGAQVNESAHAASCVDTTVIRPYRQCALEFDFGVVRQAPDWHAVGRDTRFHRMPLSRLVYGDSALRYARQYEHDVHVADRLFVLGTVLVASAVVVTRSYRCGTRNAYSGCSNNAEPYLAASAAMMTGALVTGVAQLPLRRAAWRAAERAVNWHNAKLMLR